MDSTSATSMETLVSELGVLLKLLDQENLSSASQEQKTAVRNLLKRIQPSSGTATEYIYVNSSVYSNGTLFVESLFDTFDCDLAELRDVTEEHRTVPDPDTDLHALNQCPQPSVLPPASQCSSDPPPPLPTTPPPEEYYEEAVPLSPGKMPEYITTTRGSSSPPNSIEDGYEDTESYSPTCLNPRRKNSYNDSDALSSSYESYEEDEEERIPGASTRLTHQWPSDESSMPPAARDCRICAFLFRKKRFGQWAKQLTVIRDSRLQCYKSSKDAVPSIDLSLPQCTVVYAPKDARKKRHELRFTLPSGDTLVLAVQSKEQAHRWLGVIKEVCNHTKGVEESNSPVILCKTELDKRLSGEKTASDSGVCVSTGENCCRDTRENGKVRRGALAAGLKITRIISFSKKKPPRPGDPSSIFSINDPRQGYLSVLVSQVWKELWCCVRGAALHFRSERGDPRPSLPPVALQGCEVLPGLGPKHPFALRVLKASAQVAALEAGSSEELGRWLGVLLAETGTAADPESLHYDYVDVETIANIRDAARHSFLWATSSSSNSIDSRTYDEVYEGMQPQEEDLRGRPKVKPGTQLLRRPTSCSRDSGRKEPDLVLKRSGSNDPQYGRYGKTRAEEDAKRYRREKEELERERDGIRNALVTLRQQKREVKEEAKTATEQRRPWLSERLARLEDSCRGKEAERVDLELQLTLVKENLNKSLAGGVLGAPREGKPLIKAPRSRSQNVYCESVSIHCTSETRKRTAPPGYASTNGTVMQKAKEWESKKGT